MKKILLATLVVVAVVAMATVVYPKIKNSSKAESKTVALL